MKRPRVLLLNLLGTGFGSTSKIVAQSYSQGINQQKCVGLFWYSDWLLRYITSKAGVAKNMRDVLHKWTPWENCVKYQNFLTHFALSLSLECSDWWNFMTIHQIYIPYKFAQSETKNRALGMIVTSFQDCFWSRGFVPHRKWKLTLLVHQNKGKENRYREIKFAINTYQCIGEI